MEIYFWDYIETNLKMSKEEREDLNESTIRKKTTKSTDLRRRLFEIGINHSPKSSMQPVIGSPKQSLLGKHLQNHSPKQNFSGLLKYQPSHSPQLSKTHSKEFHIRKNIKSPFSPSSSKQASTLSAFYKPDTVRLQQQQMRETLLGAREKLQTQNISSQQPKESRLDQYVSLILKGVQKIDQFLYLIRGSQENIYELQLVDFEAIRSHEGQNGFQYYTVSRKGFCQYIGGKPQNFLDITDWAEQKSLYCKIKALKFFFRFRRWKTLQMWRRTVTCQRRQSIAHSLSQKMFLLQPTTRRTMLQLRKLTLEMQKSILIIARNQGSYTLQSFKHCQDRARRQASLAVEQFSRESRVVVRKCFQIKLGQLSQYVKKNSEEQKQNTQVIGGAQSPKEGAFQALGFPSKMRYQHRSRLRKEAGRFLRFSYLVDNLHLSSLSGIYSSQVNSFISHLQQLQLSEPVRPRATIEEGKDEFNSQKMFSLQLSCNFKQISSRLISESPQSQGFVPTRDIRLKTEDSQPAQWVYRLTQYWLSMQPNLEQVLDELSFLLREGLSSLKCFERWAKHREMQKYVSILEQWDDLVSENWQISQNDNLDPLLLLDSLDPILTRLKNVLRTTESKLSESVRTILTSLLNAYWEYSRLDLTKLQNPALLNPAQTFDQFLSHTTQLLQRVTNQLPHRLELGVITLHITRIKNTFGQKFAGIIQNLKIKLPELVEERGTALNDWLSAFGARLREQILNIDDYVRTVSVIKVAQAEFGERRDECNELAQLYQIMQQFRMDTRKRKDFESVTLKLKDQLDQLMIAAQQNIQRKADLYTKQVSRYHVPALMKDIAKTLEATQQPKFLKLQNSKSLVLSELKLLQGREAELIEQRKKCSSYMEALKINGQNFEALDQLSKQITDRVRLWQTLQEWENLSKETECQAIKSLPISLIIEEVENYKIVVKQLQNSLPPNEILNFLKQKVEEYYVYLPLLNGFSEALSDSHWNAIYQILPQRFTLDLKKRQFTLKDMLASGIGKWAKQIQNIFQKSRVQAKLQSQYQQLQDTWINLIAKIRTQGRFNVIANDEVLRQQLDKLIFVFTETLADPYAQSLKQYSITYQSLINAQQLLEQWLRLQVKIVEIQKLCRLLDLKKLADYNYFENAERIYKQMTKATTVKGAQMGVKLSKLIVSVTDDKIAEIDLNLSKVQENINGILREHRKIFPAFYLFEDSELLKLITEPTHEGIQAATRRILPGVKKLEIQNERITTVITIDGDRFFKNPISTNSQIEQILFQISETISQMHRRTMRTCRYKAIENNLSSLVQFHNIQHLLAVSRIDFSQYTTISIQNQQDTPQSLAQFRKVMRKDTAQDIRNRQFLKESQKNSEPQSANYLQKYDTLLMQQLVYEEVLDQLIKANIQRSQQFLWASQLKFFWEDTAADQQNITIKQLHLNLKYGNDFIGSNTKVIVQGQPQLLLGLRLSEPIVYTGNSYSLQRTFNAMGYKMLHFTCSPSTDIISLQHFVVGCYFSDYLPLIEVADLLPLSTKIALSSQTWINQFKACSTKKTSPYIRQIDHPFTLYATLRNTFTTPYSFGQSYRVVHYTPPRVDLLRSGMQLLGVFSQQKCQILLRVFSIIQFLEERSQMQGVSIQKFLDQSLMADSHQDQYQLFIRLLNYLKPKISIETYQALQKHLQSFGLVPFTPQKSFTSNKLTNVLQALWERHVVVFGGKGKSKKYFLKAQLQRSQSDMIEVFGQNLDSTRLKLYLTKLIKQQKKLEKCVLYFQSLTLPLLLEIQKLVYFDDFFQKYQNKVAFVLDVPLLDKFIDPHSLSSFISINYQASKQFINSLVNEWALQNVEQERQKSTIKMFQEIVLPTLESLNSKNEQILQQKVIKFLKHMQALLPIKNMLQASIYTLAILHRGCIQQQLKLQYFTKKHLGDDYFGQDVHINNLVYSSISGKEGMISQKALHENWMRDNSFIDPDYIMTPQFTHLLIATRRLHDKTDLGVVLEGKGNSGKSTFTHLYRQLNHQNSFYISISSKECKNWKKKINMTLQRHGLNILGARINYKQTVIVIQDVHLADNSSLLPIQLMMNYKRYTNQKGYINIKNTKFLFTTITVPAILQASSLRLQISVGTEAIKNIFAALIKQNTDDQFNLPPQFFYKIASSSYDVCSKINQQIDGEIKQGFTSLRRIVKGFGALKIKQNTNAQKQVQKFWSFALLQALKSYSSSEIIQQELKKLQLNYYNPNPLSFTHLSSKPHQKRLESLRDPKRLYNLLNERIQKYNESDTKRYGDNFQFLNFDSMLEKVVSISHSILLNEDHMLVGRNGTGKESLVKLSAFFNGLHYKQITGSIKSVILEITQSGSPTPHLFLKKINSSQDEAWLEQFCSCDFQSEILGQSEGKPRVGMREKQKNPYASKNTKSNLATSETYTMPKVKLSWEETVLYRESFRLVVALTRKQQMLSVPKQIRRNFHFDLIDQVPVASVLQYNEKLLAVDSVACSKQASQLLSEIYQYSREKLGISLRGNDDCVRLFSSFISNLVSQMSLESERFGKVLQLLQKLRNSCGIINMSLCECHSKLKQISQTNESNRQSKLEVEIQLREKSTALCIGQKLVQILSWLQNSYTEKDNSMQSYLQDKNQLQLTFAVTASYFIYLSNQNYTFRRKMLEEWRANIPLMSNLPALDSFLPLFLLYEEQFNTEPVDNLPDFYENMAIIFHSAKPIAILDKCDRGRYWLQKNCSFYYLRQDQKDFIEQISDFLTKPTNILIEVTQQETINKLTDTTIGTLLFLPESVTSINLNGEDIQVHQEAKVYILIAQGLTIPKNLIPEFTVVTFEENTSMANTALVHQYLCATQRQTQSFRLDLLRKIRNLKLDGDNAISQIAESIYEQLCGSQAPPQESILIENLTKITDKLMVRAQNQFTKIKQKEDLIADFQEKYDAASAKINSQPAQEFVLMANKIYEQLTFMGTRPNKNYHTPLYPEYFNTIKTALNKGVVKGVPSLLLLALRQWGPVYSKQDYLIFSFLLVMVYYGTDLQLLNSVLTPEGIRLGLPLQLIKRQPKALINQQVLQQSIYEAFFDIIQSENLDSITPFVSCKDYLYEPAVWMEGNKENSRCQKVIEVLSKAIPGQVKEKLLIMNSKIVEPTQQDSIESIMKKNQGNNVTVLSFSRNNSLQYQKVLKHWNAQQNSLIILYDNSPHTFHDHQVAWRFNIDNSQTLFCRIINKYLELTQIQQLSLELPEQSLRETLVLSNRASCAVQSQSRQTINQNYLKFIQNLAFFIKKQFSSAGLPIPMLKKSQLTLLCKHLENNESPLTVYQKLDCVIKYVHALIRPSTGQLQSILNSMYGRLVKAAQKSSEQQFLIEAESILSESKEYQQNPLFEEIQFMKMELSWLAKTKQLLGLPNKELTNRYLTIIDSCLLACSGFKEAPRVSRGSKRQINIKSKRDSISKRGRESLSASRKCDRIKLVPVSKKTTNQLACIQLLKESQSYQRVLRQVKRELQQIRFELQRNNVCNEQMLRRALKVTDNVPTSSWKWLMAQSGCSNVPLPLALRQLTARRNQIYTYYNKFSVSDTCEVDFKYIKHSVEFLKVYFSSNLGTRDIFLITNSLTVEEAERGEYLRLSGLWACGWRMNSQGALQHLGDSKNIQMSTCYIVKKSALGLGYCPIDLYVAPECSVSFMRVYCVAKKLQNGYKVYLKTDN